MRVGIVSPYDPSPDPDAAGNAVRGGVEVALERSAEELARRGLDVTVYCTAPEAGETERAGVRYVRARRHATLFRTPLSALHARIPRDLDMLHVPATYPTYSDVLPWLARRRGTPCVLDYHFDPVPTSPAMAAATAVYRRTLARGMRSATRVLVRSRDYARSSRALRGVPEDLLSLVPNGVDVDRFRVPAGEGDHVLCVGRLVPYKGVDVLLRAMARVQGEADAPLVVAGDGPERGRLERLARELGVDVDFRGYVPDAELPRLYAGARLTALPSANGQEAFGITLLESMAAGTPVVASALPGVREIAALGGLTVPPRDPPALAAAILRALDDSDLPRGMGLSKRVEERYAWPRVVDRLVDAYALAAGRRGSAGAKAPEAVPGGGVRS